MAYEAENAFTQISIILSSIITIDGCLAKHGPYTGSKFSNTRKKLNLRLYLLTYNGKKRKEI
jgi:hypothetical protein